MENHDRKKVKGLRYRIIDLERKILDLECDLGQFRLWFSTTFKWFVEIHGKGTHPNMGWMIEDMAKLMTRVKRWSW